MVLDHFPWSKGFKDLTLMAHSLPLTSLHMCSHMKTTGLTSEVSISMDILLAYMYLLCSKCILEN